MKTEAVLGHTKPKPGKAQGCRQPPEASLERILPPEGTHPASTLTPGLWPPGLQQSKLLAVRWESCPKLTHVGCSTLPLWVFLSPRWAVPGLFTHHSCESSPAPLSVPKPSGEPSTLPT